MTVSLPVVKNPSGPKVTDIEWATHSFNPLRAVHIETGKVGWACQKVSAGCAHCYAETLNLRFGTKEPYSAAGMKKVRVLLDEQQMAAALNFRPRPGGAWEKPWSNGRAHVFIGDMTDLFGEWVSDAQLDRLFALFALTPWITWQVLTKRPERMAAYLRSDTRHTHISVYNAAAKMTGADFSRFPGDMAHTRSSGGTWWPLPNVWLGASCEDQPEADARIGHLLRCPAAVRFLSCEPLIGWIDLWLSVRGVWNEEMRQRARRKDENQYGFDWVIVGGESGREAREYRCSWVKSIIDQCASAGIPCFHKQVGSLAIDDLSWVGSQPQLPTRDSKGGDPAEWPEDLRVREMPGGEGNRHQAIGNRGEQAGAAGEESTAGQAGSGTRKRKFGTDA